MGEIIDIDRVENAPATVSDEVLQDLSSHTRKDFANISGLVHELRLLSYSVETADLGLIDLLDSLDRARPENASINAVTTLDAITFLLLAKLNKPFWKHIISVIKGVLLSTDRALFADEADDLYKSDLDYFNLAQDTFLTYLTLRVLNSFAALEEESAIFSQVFSKEFLKTDRDTSLHTLFYIEFSSIHVDIDSLVADLQRDKENFDSRELGKRWRLLRNASSALSVMLSIPRDMASATMSSEEYERSIKSLIEHFADIHSVNERSKTSARSNDDGAIMARLDAIEQRIEAIATLATHTAPEGDVQKHQVDDDTVAISLRLDEIIKMLSASVEQGQKTEGSDPDAKAPSNTEEITAALSTLLDVKLDALPVSSGERDAPASFDEKSLTTRLQSMFDDERAKTAALLDERIAHFETGITEQLNNIVKSIKIPDINSEIAYFKEYLNDSIDTINRTHQIITELKASDEHYASVLQEKGIDH